MSSTSKRISQITYNPAKRCYEAVVTIFEGGHAHSYPVSLPGGLDAGYDRITLGILASAEKRHKADRKGMHSTRVASDLSLPVLIPTAVREATQGLWHRLLNHRAA